MPSAAFRADTCFTPGRSSGGFGKFALFGLWLAIVVPLVLNHVFWRDEVRGLSFAIQGDTLVDMFIGLRGDAHPLLWFLLLRFGHAVAGVATLPIMAFLVGAAAIALLIWRAPFSFPIKLMLILTRFALYDFSVMARNYGISMLLMFVFAALYRRHQERGIWLGTTLFLLANTNVHSMVFAWLLMIYWAADSNTKNGRTQSSRPLIFSFILLLAGSLLCFFTVWPTFNDDAVYTAHRDILSVVKAVLLPGYGFLVNARAGLGPQVLLSPILFASLLGLVRHRMLLFLGTVSLVAMSLLFALVYPGSERHIELWLVFLVTLYWLAKSRDGVAGLQAGPAERLGGAAFATLLLAQIVMAGLQIRSELAVPASRSRDLGALIASRPELKRAIVIADPDYMIEALPYYVPNPVYRLRERQFGPLVRFTKSARLDLRIADVLRDARRLRQSYGREILILLSHDLDPAAPARRVRQSYSWTFETNPHDVRRFLDQTTLLVRFGVAGTDESYSVYKLGR